MSEPVGEDWAKKRMEFLAKKKEALCPFEKKQVEARDEMWMNVFFDRSRKERKREKQQRKEDKVWR